MKNQIFSCKYDNTDDLFVKIFMLKEGVDLTQMNTLGVACKAKWFEQIETTYGLLQLLQSPQRKQEKHWIL